MGKAARRWLVGLGGLALLLYLANTRPALRGQGIDPPPKKKEGTGLLASSFSSLKMKEQEGDKDFREKVELAHEYMKVNNWKVVFRALQFLLNAKEDHYVQIRERDPAGREVIRLASAKYEANKILSTLAPEVMDAYELEYGASAKAILDEARAKGDRDKIAEVAQRFYYTRAGAEANDLLGTYFLDRGQYFTAALRFEKLLSTPESRLKISDVTLLKAALAYRYVGDLKNSELAWKKLNDRIGDRGLKLGGEVVAAAHLRKALDAIPAGSATPSDWLMIRGDTKNTAQAMGSPPLLDSPVWRRLMLLDAEVIGGFESEGKEARAQIELALRQAEDAKDRAILPGHFPIAVGNKLIYRSHSSINCVYLRDELDALGKVIAKAGDLDWRSPGLEGSLTRLLSPRGGEREPSPAPTIQGWLSRYGGFPGFSGLVYENNLVGTLSSDGRCVYFIDDLAVPIPPDQLQPGIWTGAAVPPLVKSLVMGNKLCAIEIKTGWLKWQLGTPVDGFENSHFLGAPIFIGGKLYVLNEKNAGGTRPGDDAELRLVCIDPEKMHPTLMHAPHIVEPMQYLGSVQQASRITHYPGRRLTSVHMAYGDGLLIAPTHTGELLAVDLMTRSLAWAYPYREQFPPPLPFLTTMGGPFMPPPMKVIIPGTDLKTGFFSYYPSPPAIADGKVVFAAPDANSVHCVNLNDGALVWKRRHVDGDLYMAGVYGGKVLVVNRNRVTAWKIEDGSFAWSVPTGDMPSGQGVASGGVYYLPLKRGEILAIDMGAGKIKAHNLARSGAIPAPGNLIFSEGTVVSQGPLDIVAYPQLTARLALVDKAVLANPADPEKLVERGELYLADGQVQSAVLDLEKALDLGPPEGVAKRAKNRLYDALTELLLLDFNGFSGRYLKEYEGLSKLGDTAPERGLREAKFFRIVGQGRESQGNLVEAYTMFHQFSKLPIHKDLGAVAGLDDPSYKVPIEIWMRARIGAMMTNATPEQRDPLEQRIAQEWKGVEAKKDPAEIRFFVSTFGVPFSVGREARISLAENIMARGDKVSFLEAEMYLQQVRASKFRKEAHGGRALASLALLEEKKGSTESLKLAAAYYRELSKDFPDLPVRGPLTGSALFNEMAADKRFLPYLEDGIVSWGNAKFAAREVPGGFDSGMPFFVFTPEGDLPPLMRHHRLLVDPTNVNNVKFQLLDLTTGKARWSRDVATLGSPANQKFFEFLYQQKNASSTAYQPNDKFRFFQCKGHLLVFQTGTQAVCLHADSGDVLWTQTLSDVTIAPGTPGLVLERITPDDAGHLEMVIWNQFNNVKTRVPLGHVGSVQASYVALVTQKGLHVVDPLRGNLLWKKMDVAPATRVFGDENHLFLVESAEADSTPSGRVFNASDGSPLEAAPDFGPLYQFRLRVEGRTILAAVHTRAGLALKLYDIPTGKDLWSKVFPEGAIVLDSQDPTLTGVMDNAGNVTILSADKGEELVKANVLRSQILADDLKGLQKPLLLADADRYYLALNRAVDSDKVSGGVIGNNFGNGLRCITVNGWFLALKRGDGEEKIADKARARKNGDFLWHTFKPLSNQMIVLEQFEDLPVLIFTSRINERINLGAGGIRWISVTQSVDKRTGKLIWDSGPRSSSGAPQYHSFNLDPRAGLVTMMSLTNTLQHYIDDGRKLPAVPMGPGAGLTPGGTGLTGLDMPVPGLLPAFGRMIGPRPILVRPPLRIMPAPIEIRPVEVLPDLPEKK